MSSFSVQFAVYGALVDGNENKTRAVDVSQALQTALDNNQGIVTINNANLGGDPAKGTDKHFGAAVTVNGQLAYFACREGQTIDFYHWLAPTTEAAAAGVA